MSRSFRKRPFIGATTATTEKFERRHANRALRRQNNIRIEQVSLENPDATLLHKREVTNVWDFSKDGKFRFDPQKHQEWMRK